IKANADGLKLKANQDTVDLIDGRVSSLGTEVGVVAGQISSKVWKTDIESAVDGIEVGGRNLLKGTTDEWEEQHRPTGNYFFDRGSDYKLTIGETYTFSIVVDKVSDDTTPINLHLGAGRTPKTYT